MVTTVFINATPQIFTDLLGPIFTSIFWVNHNVCRIFLGSFFKMFACFQLLNLTSLKVPEPFEK